MVMAAMLGSGAVIYVVESRRVDTLVRSSVAQEFAEFRELQSNGDDPTTGRPFDDSSRLLEVFLERNLPAPHEVLIGWVGSPRWVSAGPHGDLAADPAVRAAVPALIASGGDAVVHSAEHGEVRLSAQPIRVDGHQEDGLVVAVLMDEARGDLRALLRTYALIALVSLGLIVAVAWGVAGTLLAPIRGLNAAARKISATDLSARLTERGNDDLTDLTRTTNEMLDRLEAAFTAQRQFLDDAGHELKTPLTVLRGHLELLDSGDPDELRETRDLLLDETDRMSRLVQDLILLAKSRRPDFTVLEDVDLDQLTHAVLAKSEALGPRTWVLDEVAHATASLDEQRITQALLQLADNAVKHTDPGDTIGIGSAVDDDSVRLWVRDTGDGIDESHREAVLQRFGRGHVRAGDDGFGLGLSIVAAIAQAHGGYVHITDAPADADGTRTGAWVEIRIPRGERPWPRS